MLRAACSFLRWVWWALSGRCLLCGAKLTRSDLLYCSKHDYSRGD